MLVLLRKCEAGAGPVADVDVGTLTLTWDERRKARGSFTTDGGEEAILKLERGGRLADGDLLLAEDGRVVRVAARAEALLEVRAPGGAGGAALARAAYHLGNRHAPVEIGGGAGQAGGGWLRTAYDHVFAEMLTGLGVAVTRIEAPFVPEVGAYHAHGDHDHAHGHDHEHDHDHAHAHPTDPFRYRPKIHRFVK